MRVLILGATGQLGRHVTKNALDAGHEVTAFARNPHSLADSLNSDDLALSHPHLRLHAGDAYNADDVLAAVEGHDAVIITLGTGKSRKNTLRSDGTRNVIAAMKHHNVNRLICQTTLGCQETWDTLNFFWKRIMFGAFLRPVFLDHEEQERLTQASDLDWTIVRPSAFKDEPGDREVIVDFPPSQKGLDFTIAKREVADFLISQLDDDTYLHRSVSISR